MKFTFRKLLTGGFAADATKEGHQVQFVTIDNAVVVGWKKPEGQWINMTINDPDRFGSDRSTLKGFKAWVLAFDEGAEV